MWWRYELDRLLERDGLGNSDIRFDRLDRLDGRLLLDLSWGGRQLHGLDLDELRLVRGQHARFRHAHP